MATINRKNPTAIANDGSRMSAGEEFRTILGLEKQLEITVDLEKRIAKANSLANKDTSVGDFFVEADNTGIYVKGTNKICVLDRTQRLGPGPMLDGFWNSYFLNCKERKVWPPKG